MVSRSKKKLKLSGKCMEETDSEDNKDKDDEEDK